MNDQPLNANTVRVRSLDADAVHDFELAPDARARAAIAAELGIPAIRKLRFDGQLLPQGRADWKLVGKLGASVVQDCVVTLVPVNTRIDAPVIRTYLADPPSVPDADEIEMPEDDTTEPLPAVLDLHALMIEALALELPEYPHAPGVVPLKQSYTEPGIEPMTDDDVRPFAGLADLRHKLGGGTDE